MDIAQHNMEYLGLNEAQYEAHRELMMRPLALWPDELRAFCEERIKQQGFSGDVLAVAVADWLKPPADDDATP